LPTLSCATAGNGLKDPLDQDGYYRLAAGLYTAAEVGAPHQRERLFILAIREGD
jgi:site-specific DNA-cytosine methylase